MKIKGITFPHPVLGLSDDVRATYEAEMRSHEIRDGALEVVYEHVLSLDASITKLIEHGDALFCVEVQCLKTFYREAFCTEKSSQKVTIPIENLHGDVEIQIFVVATKATDSYAPPDAHSDYKNVRFKIKKGDVLAYAGMDKLIIERSGHEKSAMISVDEGDAESGPFKMFLGGDGILVLLPKDQYERFQKIRSSQQIPFIDRQISTPALCEAVRIVLQSKKAAEKGSDDAEDDVSSMDDRSGTQWFQVISKVLEDRYPNRKLEVDDANLIAQELLENPIALSIKLVEDLNQ